MNNRSIFSKIIGVKLRKASNLVIVFFLSSLAALSVYGAFMGAARARVFFNSVTMAVFWCLLLVFLAAGFGIYPLLKKRYSLILIHGGCMLVLAGGLYGSQAGHDVYARLFGGPSFTKGAMQLGRGQSSNQVVVGDDGKTVKLPFSIVLEDAFLDYYDAPVIRFYWGQDAFIDIPPDTTGPVPLPDHQGTVEIVKTYRNLKLKSQNGQMVPYDAQEPGSNPAWELRVMTPDGQTVPIFVFAMFPMHTMQSHDYKAEYRAPQMVKDYKSVLQVMENGHLVKAAMIEVNEPLYYGGYHIYQHTFAFDQSGPVSGLLVTSSKGVVIVFGGYLLIFVGLVIQCGNKLRRRPDRRNDENVEPAKDASGGSQ